MGSKHLTLSYEEFTELADLSPDERRLVESAREARLSAYAPYSHFHVGAALLTEKGGLIQGSNQEVSNYKVSCAERVALNTAGAQGLLGRIRKMAVVGGPENMDMALKPHTPEAPLSPCGQCRQDIKEAQDLGGTPIVIIMASRNLIRRVIGIDSLLPFAFGPASLQPRPDFSGS